MSQTSQLINQKAPSLGRIYNPEYGGANGHRPRRHSQNDTLHSAVNHNVGTNGDGGEKRGKKE